jgi:hypothetical protein
MRADRHLWLSRVFWFAGFWLAGVALLAGVSLALRMVLA